MAAKTNPSGLTLTEWLRAARQKESAATKKAWASDEDPTEYAAGEQAGGAPLVVALATAARQLAKAREAAGDGPGNIRDPKLVAARDEAKAAMEAVEGAGTYADAPPIPPWGLLSAPTDLRDWASGLEAYAKRAGKVKGPSLKDALLSVAGAARAYAEGVPATVAGLEGAQAAARAAGATESEIDAATTRGQQDADDGADPLAATRADDKRRAAAYDVDIHSDTPAARAALRVIPRAEIERLEALGADPAIVDRALEGEAGNLSVTERVRAMQALRTEARRVEPGWYAKAPRDPELDREVPERSMGALPKGRSYIVKLTGTFVDSRKVDGEYDGGKTIESARAKAASFVAGGVKPDQIRIAQATPDGDLEIVEHYGDVLRSKIPAGGLEDAYARLESERQRGVLDAPAGASTTRVKNTAEDEIVRALADVTADKLDRLAADIDAADLIPHTSPIENASAERTVEESRRLAVSSLKELNEALGCARAGGSCNVRAAAQAGVVKNVKRLNTATLRENATKWREFANRK